MEGWIRAYRQMLDNPVVCKDKDYFAVWMYLLLNATHKKNPAIFKGKKITLQPGQLITGRKVIAKKFKIDENKVQRILKCLENEHQIKQQTGNKNRLITIINWNKYQQNEQQNKQQVNNKRTTTEQQVNTNNNVNNVNNEKKKRENKSKTFAPPTLKDVEDYIEEKNLNVNAEHFYNYFTEGNWIDSKGNPVKNWKQKLITWDNHSSNKKNNKILGQAIIGKGSCLIK